MLRKISLLIFLVIILLIASSFVWLNHEIVDLELAFAKFTMPIWQVFLIAFILGWIVGLLFAAFYILRLLNEKRKLQKKVRVAEAEVSNLRTLPLQDAH